MRGDDQSLPQLYDGQNGEEKRELIICTDDEYKHIEASAGQFTLAQILRGLDLFQSTLVKIKGGATPRIEMEMAFIRLCEPKLETDPDAINQRLSALERAVQNGVPAAPVKTVQSPLRQRALHRHNRLYHPPRSPRPQRQHLRRSRSLYLRLLRNLYLRLLRNLYLHLFRSLRLYSLNRLSLWKRQRGTFPRPAADSEQKLFMQWADLMEILHRTDIALLACSVAPRVTPGASFS